MSAESSPPPAPEIAQYGQFWGESLSSVLEAVGGAPFPFEPLPAGEAEPFLQACAEAGEWVRFAAEKGLRGEQALVVSVKDAVTLARLLMGEPPDEAATLSDEYRDALGELFRQFAGSVASSWKGQRGTEIDLKFEGMEKPGWTAAATAVFRVTGGGASIAVGVFLSPDLVAALRPPAPVPPPNPPAEAPAPPAAVAAAAPPPAAAAPAGRNKNLELLLDIELDAMVCFGEQELLLKDVLAHGPGSFVETKQHTRQPMKLLVAGKEVARGEVVIVEGSYGLRITEIASRQQRIASFAGSR